MAPVGIGDVVAAFTILYKAAVLLFSEDRRSSILYAQFKEDVIFFDDYLYDLQSAYAGERAEGQPNKFAILDKLCGDFEETLKECMNFLKRYASHTKPDYRTLKTVTWHLGPEQASKRLLSFIHTHNERIKCYIVTHNFKQQLRANSVATVIEPEQTIPAIPEELTTSYANAWPEPDVVNSPRPFVISKLKDALHFHYERWTVKGVSDEEGTAEQLNDFLKTQWIVERIRAVNNPDRELQYLSEQAYKKLQKTYTELAVVQSDSIDRRVRSIRDLQCRHGPFLVGRPSHEARRHERKVFEGNVDNVMIDEDDQIGDCRLLVFRKGLTTFRLLMLISADTDRQETRNSPQIVPWYAISGQDHSIEIGGMHFTFRDEPLVLKMQQAFTDYAVLINQPRVSWTLKWNKFKIKEVTEARCVVQIWEYGDLAEVDPVPLPLSETASFTSSTSNPSISIAEVPQNGRRRQSVSAKRKDLSLALAIFAKYDKKPTYILFPLSKDIDINENLCFCGPADSKCCTLGLDILKKTSGELRAKVLQGGRDNMWETLDLRQFAYLEVSVVGDRREMYEWRDAKKLLITFENFQLRRDFNKILYRALSHREGSGQSSIKSSNTNATSESTSMTSRSESTAQSSTTSQQQPRS